MCECVSVPAPSPAPHTYRSCRCPVLAGADSPCKCTMSYLLDDLCNVCVVFLWPLNCMSCERCDWSRLICCNVVWAGIIWNGLNHKISQSGEMYMELCWWSHRVQAELKCVWVWITVSSTLMWRSCIRECVPGWLNNFVSFWENCISFFNIIAFKRHKPFGFTIPFVSFDLSLASKTQN